MKTVKYISTILAMVASYTMAADGSMPQPENPATGIWIQQIGDLVPHAATKATLYYTKYYENDRVKSIDYQYDGAGYLQMKPSSKKTLCTQNDGIQGGDGIVHHPDGDLLVAAQGKPLHKVNKTAKDNGGKCLVKTSYARNQADGFWHLMMDPNGENLWAAGIPGYLYRFSTKTDPNNSNFASTGYKVELVPKDGRNTDKKLATLIWDGEGTAFFTHSNYFGGGCEANYGTRGCNATELASSSYRQRLGDTYFGLITDTTWTTVTSSNQSQIGGKIGEKVITKLGTKILIDSLEGAHGGAYDPYSKTIFVFGGAKIVQIQPYREGGQVKAKVIATIDLRKYVFEESVKNLTMPRTKDGAKSGDANNYPGVGWRLDQGTVDGYGHLFVASNTGHMIFVDFAANPKKRIDDNILIHVQWIDNYLDDVAPLSGVGVVRDNANTGSDEEISSGSKSSSSLVVYEGSSSSAGGNNGSSGSNGNNGSSNSNGNNSSGSNNGSSGSNGGGNNGSSGSNGGGDNGSSGSNGGGDNGSSGSNGGGNNGSSDSNGGNNNGSSGSNGGSNNGSSGSNGGNNNGSSGSNGGNNDGNSSSSNKYDAGAEDYADNDDPGINDYLSAEDFEKGDELVSKTVTVEPVESSSTDPNKVTVGGNDYVLNDDPKGIPMDLRYNSGLDSAKVGDVVAITLDPEKVKEILGNVDSIKVVSETDVKLVNPATGDTTSSIKINSDGSVTIFVTANQAVRGGSIKIYGDEGKKVVIDNINFYDPIPDTRIGYIKDSDSDNDLDYIEILLADSLPSSYGVEAIKLIVGGKTYECVPEYITIMGDRIVVTKVDALALPGVGEFPKDAKAVITYIDKAGSGATTQRETSLIEIGSNVIKDAYAIRNSNGQDSLFLQFNIDLVPADVSSPEMLVWLKQTGEHYGLEKVDKVYMPAKDIIILTGESFKLKGNDQDSVSLYPAASFENLPYITSDEYDREVPVKVVDRFASSTGVEYWDTDGDGTLDQIVTVFDRKLTAEDLNSLYMSFPWYSYRGMMIQLQAQPADLKLDPNDSTRVIWNVMSTTRLASGVTSISDKLPDANIYTYYTIFGETFVAEETAPLIDKMAPVVASATLNYGNKADTLFVTFSEPILTKGILGDDYFSYIHGDETINIYPSRIDWSADGLTAKLVFNGNLGTIMPGDSLVVHKGSKDALKDNYNNTVGENPQAVIIGGLLNHLVEATQMGSFDLTDKSIVDEDENKTYTLQTVSSVNLRYVPGSTTKEDMEKEGALGQLVQLGERFVPQLLDRAQVSADGSYDPSVLDSLKPEDVYISFVVNYFDHLGQYVNDTTITVPCNSPKFGGNCLETDKKVFVNWNFKDHKGRFVGTGIYNVKFRMIVRYQNKKIEEEIKDKWGVRRKKKK